MTETEISTRSDRTVCPDCGREVAVNRDGSLRKHTCEPAEPAQIVQELPAAVAPPEAGPEPAPPQAARTAGGRALCRLAGCDRVAVLGSLCGAHWATRPDLRKVT